MDQSQNVEPKLKPAKPKAFLRWVWLPLLGGLTGLAIAFWVSQTWPSRWMVDIGLLLFAGSTLYFLVQMIGRLCLRQWRAGLWAFARLSACILALVASVFISMFTA